MGDHVQQESLKESNSGRVGSRRGTCGWIESYALKFFKSGFMDKPSAKRRRNAISQSQLRSPLRSFRTAPWASLKAKMWNSAS